jgi:hypothetical protein
MSDAARIPDFPEMPEDGGNPDLRPDAQNASLPSTKRQLPRASEPAGIPSRPLNFVYESLSEIGEACRPFVESSVEWMRGVGRSVKRAKEEKPLQCLAVIAGAAFVLGVAGRIGRKNHELQSHQH